MQQNRIAVVDFDHTLATTQCRVQYTQPNGLRWSVGPSGFDTFVPPSNATVDFVDFRGLRGVQPIQPMVNYVRRCERLGIDVLILTARGNRPVLARYLKRLGLSPMIIALNDGRSVMKASVIKALVEHEGYTKVSFYDDSYAHILAVHRLTLPMGCRVKAKQV